MHRIITAFVVALVLGNLVIPSARADENDWRLLYAEGDLRDGTGALKSNIDIGISIDFPTGRFSPSGTRLAVPEIGCLPSGCDRVRGSVRIKKPDGTSAVLAWVPDFGPTALSWSADGSKVAVLGRVITPDDIDTRIYVFPVSGGPATLVYSDTQLLQISPFGGLSWNPVDGRLAFIATEFASTDGGIFSVPGGSDQVWTVAATALATPSRFTGTPVCGDCDDTPLYNEPTWSPDGSRLAVVSIIPDLSGDGGGSGFVGFLSEGALSADKLVDAGPRGQMAWSDDGNRLAYGIDDTSGDFYDETVVVDAGTGAFLATVEGVIAPFVDWLPCPTGTCQVWEKVYVAPQPVMNIKGVAKRGKVIATGDLRNTPPETAVSVTLSKRAKAGARWRKVTTVQVPAIEGLFRRSFPRPDAVQCKVKGVYQDGDARAVDTAVFNC